MTIAIDFDGTCVMHKYPKVGEDIGAGSVLRELVLNGHQLVLNSMRADNTYLQDALDWFKRNDIPLYAIGKVPGQEWSNTNKCQADLYIDDAALGCPLIYPEHGRPFVDWRRVRQILLMKEIIKPVLNEKKL